MNEGKRHLKFWTRVAVQNMGCILALGLFMLIVAGFTQGQIFKGVSFIDMASVSYPFYVFFGAAFWLLSFGVGYFRTYYPVCLSFNARRKTTHIGLMLQFLAVSIVSVVCVFISQVLMKVSEPTAAFALSALLLGALLGCVGVGVIFGVLGFRYGKLGIVISLFLGASFGGIFGVSVAMNPDKLQSFISNLLDASNAAIVLLVGTILFIASGILTHVALKKYEVRI